MTITFTISDPSFWTSPGAGGLGAVIAAILLGGAALFNAVIQKRAAAAALKQLKEEHKNQGLQAKAELEEAANARRAIERHQAIERWWTQYIWLTDTARTLDLETRFRVAVALTNEANRLQSEQLIELSQSYTLNIRLEKLQQGR